MAVSTSCGDSAVSIQALEEVVGLDGAAAGGTGDLDLAAERQQTGRQFGGRIGERNRAAERAAVADRRVADMRHGERDQRRMAGDLGRALGLSMASQRSDLELAVLQRDPVETGDMIDVDQQRRMGEPHVESRDQALAAGQNARIAAVRAAAAEQLDCMVEGLRPGVGERRRLHANPPFEFFLFCRGIRDWAMRRVTRRERQPCLPWPLS